MKSVLIVRHAKSSWDDPAQADFDRPLNERGKRDAPMMARKLLDKKVKIDAFISSPAKRAKRTAASFADEYGINKDALILLPELYHAGPAEFYNAIAGAPSNAGCIAIFSHNPGITEFANMLTEVRIDNMPTCAVFAVKTAISHWNEFAAASKNFWFFDYPKNA